MRKRHLKWLWILVIFFVGCAAAPVQKTDLSKIKFGCSMEEVKKTIPGVPEMKLIPPLFEEMLTVWLAEFPVPPGVNTERLKKGTRELPRWTLMVYHGDRSYDSLWFIFGEKNTLSYSGEGPEEYAHYKMYCEAIDMLKLSERLFHVKVTHVKAETLKCQAFRKQEKDNPYMSYFDEILKHRIMLAEKLDKKEITEKEFDYLTTQKQNEMYNEAMRNIRDKYGADNRGGLTPSQALMMGWFLSRPHYAPYRPPYIGSGPGGFPIYNPSPY
ncbi:MAG: hypothetical protein JRD43_00475 [Deltaproteobacteria bacterium]|nr:hypothetical protein [Deltaproteobacteria bacterium]